DGAVAVRGAQYARDADHVSYSADVRRSHRRTGAQRGTGALRQALERARRRPQGQGLFDRRALHSGGLDDVGGAESVARNRADREDSGRFDLARTLSCPASLQEGARRPVGGVQGTRSARLIGVQGRNCSARGTRRAGCETRRHAFSSHSHTSLRVSRGSIISSIWNLFSGPIGPRALSIRALISARNAAGSLASASWRLYAASMPPSGGMPPTS